MKTRLLFLFFFVFFQFSIKLKAESTIVESDSAHYDGIKLRLQGHVCVQHVLGQVMANHAILWRDQERRSKIDFPWIELKEHVLLRFSTGAQIQCEQVNFDYFNLKSTLIGHPQIHYRDHLGEVYADYATIDYEEKEKKIQANKITLTGNIQLIRNPIKEKEKALQYALADGVQFFPHEELMILKSDEGKRVLFYDLDKELQLSARMIQAQKNGPEGREVIQGSGDVRFVFKEDELNKLKEQFHWNESSS